MIPENINNQQQNVNKQQGVNHKKDSPLKRAHPGATAQNGSTPLLAKPAGCACAHAPTNFTNGEQVSPNGAKDLGLSGPNPKVLRQQKEWATIKCADHAKNTINPIRGIVDALQVTPNPEKSFIKLCIGDPSITGMLPVHETTQQAIMDSLMSGRYNGYGPATGFPEVREALAKYTSTEEFPVSAGDIILTSGCSHALQIAIEALANCGQNILIPAPGFPLYETLMTPHGIESRHYPLNPLEGWQINLTELEARIDDKTAAIVVNNPSNPCGAVYSREHLEALLKIADKYKVPIIADEIYGDMVYGDAVFHPLHQMNPRVPVVTCDGISKRWLCPGWRLGWIMIHDTAEGLLSDVAAGMRQLATKIVGPSALVQGALPDLLEKTPPEFFQRTRDVVERNAQVVMEILSTVPGLQPIQPAGAIYMMLLVDMTHFPDFKSELELTQALIEDESVFCLPGTAFCFPNSLRLVLTYSPEVMAEAAGRIRDFCVRYFVAKEFPDHYGHATNGHYAKSVVLEIREGYHPHHHEHNHDGTHAVADPAVNGHVYTNGFNTTNGMQNGVDWNEHEQDGPNGVNGFSNGHQDRE